MHEKYCNYILIMLYEHLAKVYARYYNMWSYILVRLIYKWNSTILFHNLISIGVGHCLPATQKR